jgi:hypothetical protein
MEFLLLAVVFKKTWVSSRCKAAADIVSMRFL